MASEAPQGKDFIDIECGSISTFSKEGLKKTTRRIPLIIRFVLDLFWGSILILAPAIILSQRVSFPRYPLNKFVKEVSVQMEFIRWTAFIEVAWLSLISCYHTSILIPRWIAYFARHDRAQIIPSTRSTLEFLSHNWTYVSYNIATFLLWLTSISIFPYRPVDGLDWTLRDWQFYFERSLLQLFIMSVFLTIEKFLLHLIVIEFNRSVYRERVFQCMYSLWVIKVLRGAAQQTAVIRTARKGMPKLFRQKPGVGLENVFTPQSFPFRSFDLLSTFLLENLKVDSAECKGAASVIFSLLCDPARGDHIVMNDLKPYFTVTEFERAFNVLDKNANGDVTLPELKSIINSVYKERLDLIESVTGHSKLTTKLDMLMICIMLVVAFFSAFKVFGYSPQKALPLGLSFTPTIVALTVMFGETIKSIFAAIIFLFATHPYDVGDRVYMDQVSYFVQKIGLLSTVFMRWDGFLVYLPNYILADRAICNVRRVGQQGQRIEVHVAAGTPTAKLHQIRSRLTEFIQLESRDFAAVKSCSIELTNMAKITLVFILRHKINFQDGPLKSDRVNKFFTFLRVLFAELEIEYFPPSRKIEMMPPEI